MYKEQIEQLRNAYSRQDWNLLRQALEGLTCLLSQQALTTITSYYIRKFVDEFLDVYPDYRRTYNKLIFGNIGALPIEYVDILLKEFDNHRGQPGVNNFRTALQKYQSLLNLEYCTPPYVEAFVSSLIDSNIAITSQSWGIENPELYYQWLDGTTTEELSILAKYYARDPKVTEKSRLLWNVCAEFISKQITINYINSE